ncbi:hypothetical protein DFH07DRAFT_956191 [Mycena maculata]|uniref:Uncharacterized protein n=1 Tax=Mycena maculata TaxID=230809 RepID=A0AAD7JIQ8_9AGAR|nr:hypothetical protein DFH07DRAFT_956191 [Mycena maculata]
MGGGVTWVEKVRLLPSSYFSRFVTLFLYRSFQVTAHPHLSSSTCLRFIIASLASHPHFIYPILPSAHPTSLGLHFTKLPHPVGALFSSSTVFPTVTRLLLATDNDPGPAPDIHALASSGTSGGIRLWRRRSGARRSVLSLGMDQRAERMVHNSMVDVTCKEDSAQYFLITPKLLPDLEYHRRMKILCVNNGEWLLNESGLGNMMAMINGFVMKNPGARCA